LPPVTEIATEIAKFAKFVTEIRHVDEMPNARGVLVAEHFSERDFTS
jgi:hypothetical protein